MSEELTKPKTLLSDPKVLHKIKFIQFRRQLVPLGVVILLMLLNVFFPQKLLLYPTLAAFAWYLLERILLRTKNKILVPAEDAFVCPVDGKVLSVRRGEDMTYIAIRKSWLDIAEVRLPYPDLQKETDGTWRFDTRKGQINVKVKTNKINTFENFPVHGGVIGVIRGSAIFTIYLPAGIKALVKVKETVFGGETELFRLSDEEEFVEIPHSILVEEPIEELT